MGHDVEHGHSAAGWMALAAWDLEAPTADEVLGLELLEAEVLNSLQWWVDQKHGLNN